MEFECSAEDKSISMESMQKLYSRSNKAARKRYIMFCCVLFLSACTVKFVPLFFTCLESISVWEFAGFWQFIEPYLTVVESFQEMISKLSSIVEEDKFCKIEDAVMESMEEIMEFVGKKKKKLL